ncbi:MAG TPA: nuclear transport factor 2 family protein [Rhodoferax sp.]|jgi:ketosteroid isomerase-like protein|nr:nuclear transport factor 2 family protein [Rhodoferax sp.]HNV60208.1 nuclear transport factor 2 family protein [Rhodoferax sp.]HPW27751.1 nuclear transport factor 2 family protein [Rhodoferax sp.]
MSEAREPRTETRIEEAMRTHGLGTSGATVPPAPREEKRRLQRRLEQLQTTIGESGPPPAAEKRAPPPAEVNPGMQPGTGRLVVVSLFSLFIGAGLMWLAMQKQQAPAPSPLSTQPTGTNSKPALSAADQTSVSTTVAQSVIQGAPKPEQEARALLEQWRQAWANRDADTYLSYYDPAFAPTGQSHNQWAAARRAKLAGQSEISIHIRDIQVTPINAQQMRVSFLQDYASGKYKEVARTKTLQLQRGPKGWLIIGEQQAPQRK